MTQTAPAPEDTRYVTKTMQRELDRTGSPPFENSGAGRNRARRAYRRGQTNAVNKANRRRQRDYRAQQFAAGTLRQQLRIYAGEVAGTQRQYVRIATELEALARRRDLTVDDFVLQLRAAVGLPIEA